MQRLKHVETIENLTLDPGSTVKAARIAGAWYLLLAVVAPFGLLITPTMIVSGDAAATARNILASETLFRLGIASELAAAIVSIFLVMALYRLFRSVNQGYARLMVILGALVSVPISFLNILNEIAALELLHGPSFLSSFSQSQQRSLAMLFLDLHSMGLQVVGIFFGLWLFPFALLVYKSGFIPRIFGVLLILNGVGYLINSAATLFLPAYASSVSSIATLLDLVGEPPIVAWLLIKGATAQKVTRPSH